MKFRVIIDKAKEEEVVATVHRRTDLIDEIESLILRDEQTDALAAYQEDEIRLLELNDVECITADDGKVYAIADGGKRYLLKNGCMRSRSLCRRSSSGSINPLSRTGNGSGGLQRRSPARWMWNSRAVLKSMCPADVLRI